MRRCFCDACEKEIKSSGGGTFAVKVHALDTSNVNNMYSDLDGNPVSGRMENLDLCNICYNRIMEAAVSILREIQSQRPSEKEK